MIWSKSIRNNFLPALLVAAGIAFGQDSILIKAEKLIQLEKYDSSLLLLDKVDYSKFSLPKKAAFFSSRANVYLALDEHDRSFDDYSKARLLWKEIDSLERFAFTNLQIVEVLSHKRNSETIAKPYLDEYIAYANESGDPLDLANAYDRIARTYMDVDDIDNSLKYFELGIEKAYEAKDTLKAISLKFNSGAALNSNKAKRYSEALQLFKETLPYFKKIDNPNYIAYNYNNLAKAYRGMGDYTNAIKYYVLADSIPLSVNDLDTKRIFYENMAETYDEARDYVNATAYLKYLVKMNDSISKLAYEKEIADADAKYRTSEKEKALLLEQQQSAKNRTISWSLGGTLALGSVIGFLVYRNTKRKQRIAEQEKQIEIQKAEKILKDQELNTIDAMISGQEKERQRLAGELHDSVGATLSAAKMQFEHLKKNKGKLENEDELFESTKSLLDEAYGEVRNMAHAKNSGVIAKNGLLPAVKKLAKNASATGKLKIEVQDYGLEQRLEASLEIALFRIIQELVTNVIKHAAATEASVSLTQHEDSINVVVEDNGKGFTAGNLSANAGMGLGSIEKRVEHMEGQLEVDSTVGKGSSIIIDIPL